MRSSLIYLAVLLFAVSFNAWAQTDDPTTTAWEAEHQRAVDLAHNDQHDAALAILAKLMAAHPDNYPLRRDYVVVAAWKGDCDEAIKQYQPIKSRPDHETYLVVAIAECLNNLRHTDEAVNLVDNSLKNHPDDEDLKNSYQSLQHKIEPKSRSSSWIDAP